MAESGSLLSHSSLFSHSLSLYISLSVSPLFPTPPSPLSRSRDTNQGEHCACLVAHPIVFPSRISAYLVTLACAFYTFSVQII